MTFSILPPEYFPGPLWAAIALSSDVVVLTDTFPYIRQSLQNRARLRTPSGASWLTVPVSRGGVGRPLDSIRTDDSTPWRRTHRRTLQYHYGSSAFGSHYLGLIEAEVFGSARCTSGLLVDLTLASSLFLLRALGAGVRVTTAGALPGRPSRLAAVAASMEAGAVAVLAPGQAVGWTSSMGEARVARWNAVPYRQAFDGWVDGCSALDLLLNHGTRSGAIVRERLTLEPLHAPQS